MWLFRRSLLGKPAPEITGDTWFNASSLPPAAQTALHRTHALRPNRDLPGYVVLILFWDYSCTSCIHALPRLRALWKQYRSASFLIISIHTPEFDFARDPEKVQDAVIRFNITYPVVNDPDLVNWDSYKTKQWPRSLLVNKKGIIEYDHAGVADWDELEPLMHTLLS